MSCSKFIVSGRLPSNIAAKCTISAKNGHADQMQKSLDGCPLRKNIFSACDPHKAAKYRRIAWSEQSTYPLAALARLSQVDPLPYQLYRLFFVRRAEAVETYRDGLRPDPFKVAA